ncbi:hypothetical protein SAY86_028053 [Trapa natans]|uniref:RHOMBOID-like protein n=1 Tax=Trapa natans TaxID=22666 RepID=A0AAN7MC86_TRANT|nr:hypothetical protein SAY86_028053 [Trapa natans]
MSSQDPEAKELPPPPGAAQINQNNPHPNVSPSYPNHYKETTEKRWTAWLVPMVVLAEIIFFVIVMFVNNCPDNKNDVVFMFRVRERCTARFLGRFAFQPWKENRLLGPSTSTLVKVGALHWWRVVHDHQGWRLFSAIWLHAGLIHLIINLLSVIFVGIRLEQQFGFIKVGIIYVLSGFGGCILACIFLPWNDVTAGASAPLFGILGAMLAELLINCTIYSNKVAAIFTLIVVGAINAALGILPRVGNLTNIGGLATGFLLGFILLVRSQQGWNERSYQSGVAIYNRIKSRHKPYQYILWLMALVILIVGLTAGLVKLFKGKNGNMDCSWCHYLSCVPTSKWRCDTYT